MKIPCKHDPKKNRIIKDGKSRCKICGSETPPEERPRPDTPARPADLAAALELILEFLRTPPRMPDGRESLGKVGRGITGFR